MTAELVNPLMTIADMPWGETEESGESFENDYGSHMLDNVTQKRDIGNV